MAMGTIISTIRRHSKGKRRAGHGTTASKAAKAGSQAKLQHKGLSKAARQDSKADKANRNTM